jgi:HAD superfamily hydrolase (TIGR01509 family)
VLWQYCRVLEAGSTIREALPVRSGLWTGMAQRGYNAFSLDHRSSIIDPLMPLHTSRIRAICFDVDGTLSDTDDVIVERLAGLLRSLRLLFRRRDPVQLARRLVMASEAPANLIIGLPDLLGLDDELIALADWLARRTGRRPRSFRLIRGVREMLAQLGRRYPLAVVSARDERTTGSFLERFDLGRFFRCVAAAQTCRHTKPFPDPVLWAARQMGVPAEACLMVGDTTVDIRAGAAAGAQTVGVLCGFGEEAELRRRGADMILSETAELVEVLEGGRKVA